MNFKRFDQFIPHILIFILPILILLSSVFYPSSGLLHHESQSLLLNYYDNTRPSINVIFDVFRNDGGYYQSRELSYFFDFLDAQFIKLSALQGSFHLHSLTYYVALISIIIMAYYLARNFFTRQLSKPVFILVTSLFLTSPVIYLSNFYFRSAKILTAFFLTASIVFFLRFTKKAKKLDLIMFILASLFMSLSDRQGYFAQLSFLVVTISAFFIMRKKKYLVLFLAAFVAVIISNFYTYFAAPKIIYQKTGFAVNLRHLRMDFDNYLDLTYETIGYKNPNTLQSHLSRVPGNIKQGGILLTDSISYMFGSIHFSFFISLIMLFLFYLSRKNLKLTLIITLCLFLAWTMTIMLIIKHPPILWADLRRHYYMIAPTTLGFLFALFALSQIEQRIPRAKSLITIALSILLGFNMLFLPYHLKFIRDYGSSPAFKYAPELVRCVRQKNIKMENFNLSPDSKQMCQRLRTVFAR